MGGPGGRAFVNGPAEDYLDEDSHSSDAGDRWVPENLSYLL